MGKYVQQDFHVDFVSVDHIVMLLWFSFHLVNIVGITTMISTSVLISTTVILMSSYIPEHFCRYKSRSCEHKC